jgi:tRNA(Ile)-lysidine synthase
MRALKERVAGAMRTLAPEGARVVVAVSGGPDSVALTYLLRELQPSCGFVLAGLAHFNHRLRGSESEEDAAFCRQLAHSIGLPFVSESAEVAAVARASKRSLEDTARRLRYEFLERAREQLGADVIAVAHTRDDQAETYLLRLVRGAGARGLASMRPRRGRVIRPLLDVGRAELHAVLAASGVAYRTDLSNLDVSFPRNRVRHEVLPVLSRISPAAGRSIARAARLAADDEDFLEARAIEAAPAVVLSDGEGTVRLDLAALRALHPAVGRRVIRQALARVAPDRFVSAKHLEDVWRLTAGQLDLPGMGVSAESGRLTLSRQNGRRAGKTQKTNEFRYSLSIPGEARIRESGVSISAEIVIGGRSPAENPDQAVLIPRAAVGPEGALFVRNRRQGDRLRPFGMSGRRKLQDYLVDRKVPRSERDRVPIVVDDQDRIVWVVGHTVAEDFRVTDPEQAVLLLKVRYFGGTV